MNTCPKCNREGIYWDGRAKILLCPWNNCSYVVRNISKWKNKIPTEKEIKSILTNNNISKTYLLTDSHFSHTLMQKYCNRPPDFGQRIINQWQATVGPQDIVYHLGDVTWGSQGQLQQIMSGLPGTKILVRGNHDRNHSNNWFMKAGFAAVVEKVQVSGVILSHFPALMTQEEIDYGIINIHGHFHNNSPKKWEQRFKDKITSNHFLMVLENVEYRPIDLQKARKGKFVYNSKKLLESDYDSNIK